MRFQKGLPTSVKILDITYKIAYLDKLSEVDHNGREPLLGQVDSLMRTIRILDGGRQKADILQTLWHEIIHMIFQQLYVEAGDGEPLWLNEKVVDLTATGINLVLQTNPFLVTGETDDADAIRLEA